MPDIFDRLVSQKKDIFDRAKEIIDQETVVEEAIRKANQEIVSSVKTLIKANKPQKINLDLEVSKRLPPPLDIEALRASIKEEILKSLPKLTTPQVLVQKITEPTKETVTIVDSDTKSSVQSLKKEIESLSSLKKEISASQKMLEETKVELEELKKSIEEKNGDVLILGAPSSIPNQAGQSGKVLSTTGDQLKWVAQSVSSGGGSYWGTGNINNPDAGDWKIEISGNNLSVQRYEGSSWVEKGSFLP